MILPSNRYTAATLVRVHGRFLTLDIITSAPQAVTTDNGFGVGHGGNAEFWENGKGEGQVLQVDDRRFYLSPGFTLSYRGRDANNLGKCLNLKGYELTQEIVMSFYCKSAPSVL